MSSSDWKELDDVSKPCSSENGWCGWCGNCSDHSDELHERDYPDHSWGDD